MSRRDHSWQLIHVPFAFSSDFWSPVKFQIFLPMSGCVSAAGENAVKGKESIGLVHSVLLFLAGSTICTVVNIDARRGGKICEALSIENKPRKRTKGYSTTTTTQDTTRLQSHAKATLVALSYRRNPATCCRARYEHGVTCTVFVGHLHNHVPQMTVFIFWRKLSASYGGTQRRDWPTDVPRADGQSRYCSTAVHVAHVIFTEQCTRKIQPVRCRLRWTLLSSFLQSTLGDKTYVQYYSDVL